jgi:predicted PurR-regulated permease PerM
VTSELRLNWLIAIALTGWLLYLLAPVLTPFVASALLAYIGDPLADRLQRLRMPRTLAVIAVFVLTFLVLVLLVVLVGPLIRTQISALFDALPEIARQFEQVWMPNIAGFLNIEVGEEIGIRFTCCVTGTRFSSTWARCCHRSSGRLSSGLRRRLTRFSAHSFEVSCSS